MDIDPRMSDAGADRALRGLFQQAGHLSAPEGIEARVLNRLAVLPKAVQPASALLPTWVWYALLLALLIPLYLTKDNANAVIEPQLPSELIDWLNVPTLHSEWVILGALCLTALVSLHAVLLRGMRLGR